MLDEGSPFSVPLPFEKTSAPVRRHLAMSGGCARVVLLGKELRSDNDSIIRAARFGDEFVTTLLVFLPIRFRHDFRMFRTGAQAG